MDKKLYKITSFESNVKCKMTENVGAKVGSGVPRNFFLGGGVQQIQLRAEGGENVDLGAAVH
jgi:hypothetical protein